MGIDVKLATPTDAETVHEIIRDAFDVYLSRLECPPAPLLANYGKLIDEEKVWIATDLGEILGLLVAYRRRDNFHVETVAVSPIAQGRKIGRMLMDFAESRARDESLAAVELYTNTVMTENLSFYEALGYEIVGEGMEDGFRRIFFRKAV